jgi:protein-disulfide isomerase
VPLLEQVLEKYPEDVKVVFKNFPLRNHKYARKAAIAALAADKQGKFWEFHDLLFENYNRLSDERIKKIAEELGLDMEKFGKDQKDPQILKLINRDMSEGRSAGVRGTPTVFANGRLLRNRSLEGFQALIDKALNKVSKGK